MSDIEAFALSAIGCDYGLQELMGPRGDNVGKKLDMYRQIAKNGYASLADMKEDRTKSTTLNTINTYLLASGIRSDLVNNVLKTEYTIKQDLKK